MPQGADKAAGRQMSCYSTTGLGRMLGRHKVRTRARSRKANMARPTAMCSKANRRRRGPTKSGHRALVMVRRPHGTLQQGLRQRATQGRPASRLAETRPEAYGQAKMWPTDCPLAPPHPERQGRPAKRAEVDCRAPVNVKANMMSRIAKGPLQPHYHANILRSCIKAPMLSAR